MQNVNCPHQATHVTSMRSSGKETPGQGQCGHCVSSTLDTTARGSMSMQTKGPGQVAREREVGKGLEPEGVALYCNAEEADCF